VPPPANGSRIGGGWPSVDLRISAWGFGEQFLVADVLPNDKPFDQGMEPSTLGLLRLLGGEIFRVRGRVVDELCEEDGPGGSKRAVAPHQRCRVEGCP